MLETLSEPVVLLLTMAAVAVATFAPAIHYHQFGEPTRMARDAGVSAVLLVGAVVAAYAAGRTVRREIETDTVLVALSHPVSPALFFSAKAAGSLIAALVFFATVSASSLTVVTGAAIGGALARVNGDIAQLWGPSYALAVAVMVLPITIAAALNRFRRFRFTLSANVLALATALCGSLYRIDFALASRLLPALALAAVPPLVLLVASAAFAVRFSPGSAAALVALVAAAMLPAAGNYCLSDALAGGGSVPLGYFAMALAAALPAAAGFWLLGISLFERRMAK